MWIFFESNTPYKIMIICTYIFNFSTRCPPWAPNPPLNLKHPRQPNILNTIETSDQIRESEPTTLDHFMSRSDWPQWKAAIEAEYSSLRKHNVFGEICIDLPKPPIGYKLIFTRKIDARSNNSIQGGVSSSRLQSETMDRPWPNAFTSYGYHLIQVSFIPNNLDVVTNPSLCNSLIAQNSRYPLVFNSTPWIP